MNRRGFFGLAAGAAVAGPSIAKNAIAELPRPIGNSGFLGSGAGISSGRIYPIDTPVDWRLEQINSLKRFISGELNEDEKEDAKRQRLRRRESIISQHVTCLGSVSAVRKLDIYAERMDSYERAIKISESKGYLAKLLAQDG